MPRPPDPVCPLPPGGPTIIIIVGNTGTITFALSSPNATVKMQPTEGIGAKLLKWLKGGWVLLKAKFFAGKP